MKKLTLILFLLIPLVSFCQQAGHSGEVLIVDVADINTGGIFSFENAKGSIIITGYEGDKILISGEPRFSDGTEKANSESALNKYPFSISAEIRGNEVLLLCESNGKTIDFDIKIPANFALKLKSGDNGNIRIYKIKSDIEIENPNGDIMIAGIEGSASLNTVDGNINADFKRVDAVKSSMFTSLDGNIEISIPEDSDLNFKLRSSRNEIISDLKTERLERSTVVRESRENKIVTFDDWTYCKLNEGGAQLIASTYNGKSLLKNRRAAVTIGENGSI